MGKMIVKLKFTNEADPKSQKLIPSPEHGYKLMSEEY